MPPAEELHRENLQLKQELVVLRQQLAWFKEQMFGPGKSEKFDRLQATLPLPGEAKAPEPATQTVTYERRVTHREKRSLPAESFKDVPVKETIEVSGILYRGPGDWIVWLNGQKLTPEKLLPQITEISVDNAEIVRLRWYDANRKKIIPVTMRPRQVYDVETGILSAARH